MSGEGGHRNLQVSVEKLKSEQKAFAEDEKQFNQWLAKQPKPKKQNKRALQARKVKLRLQYFKEHSPKYSELLGQLAKAEAALKKFEAANLTRVSIMEEMPKPRDTFLLVRGAYDKPDKSEVLRPKTFSSLPPMAEDFPQNRLGFARWLFQPGHPLTGRVAVNRYWQMYFGTGLVKTPEDFGSQGQRASYPQLLDWLSVEFRESGWDVKAMQKLMVMSATYRQSSQIPPALLQRDPENRLLAHGPRFRLYAQALRDQALAVSGLLKRQVGGPPVMPYQPAGLWEEVSAKGYKYLIGKGDDMHRRSMYTFWRRTVPPPNMMNFDNSTREVCSVNSPRTNTPLQAMNLLNDPQFVEAARSLAFRIVKEGGDTAKSKIQYGHKLVLSRAPSQTVLDILVRGQEDYFKAFQKDGDAAIKLLNTEIDGNAAQLASYMVIANVLLNLDETVTKE
jgi:hypothetical protein